MTSNCNIIGVLNIKGHIYGSKNGKYQYLFKPFDKKIDGLLVYTNINRIESSDDILCIVQRDADQSNKSSKYECGELINKIGCSDNFADLITSWIYFYKLEQCIKSGFKLKINNAKEQSNVESFQHDKICSVDPPNCTDIDDCFHYNKIDDDIYRLYIHIADVAHYIVNNNIPEKYLNLLVDKPFSMYLPHNVTHHMLSPKIVDCLSLRVGELRNVITLELLIDKFGVILNYQFSKNQIINKNQYTYNDVDSMIGNNNLYWSDIKHILKLLNTNYISKIANDHFDSHKMIETMMIIYNQFAMQYLISINQIPIVRIHEVPKNTHDVLLDDGLNSEFVNYLKYLEYSSAYYDLYNSSKKQSHYGLKCEIYGHFTSPIRRCVDVFNQLVLLQQLDIELSSCCDKYIHIINSNSIIRINEIEKQFRKLYRKIKLFELYDKYRDQLIEQEVYLYSNNLDSIKYYWPTNNIGGKIKLGINDKLLINDKLAIITRDEIDHKIPLFSKKTVKMVILLDILPRLVVEII